MHRDEPEWCARSSGRLVKLDLAAHGTAIASCAMGGVLLESVVLMAAGLHHGASIGFWLLSRERKAAHPHSLPGDAMFSVVQLILWACCALLAICVSALGAHGVFHSEPLDHAAMAVYAAPGAIAALTTAALTCWPVQAGLGAKADAFVSSVPTVSALCIAVGGAGIDAGRVDALAGLAAVLLLCVRTLIYVGRILD
jgi:hypothetical protein